MKTLFVTGGAGFIGSNFVRHVLKEGSSKVVVLDKLTYAGSLENLAGLDQDSRFTFEQVDICDHVKVEALFKQYHPSSLINFAAETHVDRSIDGPSPFVQTNFVGVANLLEISRHYYETLDGEMKKSFRFLQVSTDEVYGTLGETGLFSEETPYSPNSPYSATKAAADHLVQSYYETYEFPILITNCSNNYGPYQFPEKLIPLTVLNALEGKKLPIYGKGLNVRDWIYVEDHCAGVYQVLERGKLGEKYNIGAENECTNIEVVDTICETLEKLKPAAENKKLISAGVRNYSDLKEFVKDRPGHDLRYAIDASKVKKEIGWKPVRDFKKGIEETIQWYLENSAWCEAVQKDNYNRERLGINK